MSETTVSGYIRSHLEEIAARWRNGVAVKQDELSTLAPELLDRHLPDVLQRIADRMDDWPVVAPGFDDLVDDHALQRLGSGVSFGTINAEYAELRSVLFEQLSTLDSLPHAASDMKRMNEALDQALARALSRYEEHREAMAEKLLTMVGHDLRNPLNAASIAAEALARSESLSQQGERRLAIIERANLRIAGIIDQLLQFGHGQVGAQAALHLAEGDFGEACQAALAEAKQTHPTRTFVFEAHGDLHARFDGERVRQALSNLLVNAVDHGRDPIRLKVAEITGGTKIVTEVTNHGATIAPAVLPTLFDSFVRRSNHRARARGLGLYIVSLVARAHAARCSVISAADTTSFSISWPRLSDLASPQAV